MRGHKAYFRKKVKFFEKKLKFLKKKFLVLFSVSLHHQLQNEGSQGILLKKSKIFWKKFEIFEKIFLVLFCVSLDEMLQNEGSQGIFPKKSLILTISKPKNEIFLKTKFWKNGQNWKTTSDSFFWLNFVSIWYVTRPVSGQNCRF